VTREASAYHANMTRYVIDAPTLLHLVANDVAVSPRHQIVAPNLIRSQALSLLSRPCGTATSPRIWRFSTMSASPS